MGRLKLFICLLTIIFFGGPIYAQHNGEWVQVASTDKGIYSIKKKSIHVLTNVSSGVRAVVGIGQHLEKADHHVALDQWAVAVEDCQRGMGKLMVYDLDGNEKASHDFVRGADSVSSGVADAMCRAAGLYQ